MTDATSGPVPADRRKFLMGTGAAAGALALGKPFRARAADRVEITFASAKFFGKQTLAEVVEAYNQAQSKVHVTYVELPPPSSSTEVHQALVQQLARRTGTPDVFTQDVVWIAEFAGAGWALPLDEYYDANVQKEYFPGTIAACTFQGKLTALPWFVDSGMLYYRKDLLEGIGAKVPETWADLDDRGTGDPEIRQGGFRLPLAGQAGRGAGLRPGLGHRLQRRRDPGARRQIGAAERRQGGRGGAVPLRHHQQDQDQPRRRAELGRGAVAPAVHRRSRGAFLRNWSYVYSISQDAKASAVVGKVGVAPLPHFPGGKSAACLGGYQYGVNAATKNREAAIDFLTWMSSPATQLHFALQLGIAPTRPGGVRRRAARQGAAVHEGAQVRVHRRHAAAGHAEIRAGHAGPPVRRVEGAWSAATSRPSSTPPMPASTPSSKADEPQPARCLRRRPLRRGRLAQAAADTVAAAAAGVRARWGRCRSTRS